MKRFTTFTIYTVISLLVLGLGVAAAQGFGQGKGHGRHGGDCDAPRGEMRLERMAERLDLTDAQIESIKALHEESRDKSRDLRKEMLRLKNELEGEMLKDDPSEKAVLALNGKLGDLRTEMKAERISTRFAVREQLTEEQREKMLAGGGFGGRGGKGGKGGGPGHRGCDRGRGCGQRGINR